MQNLFSFPLKVEDMGSGDKTYRLQADAAQLAFIGQVLKVDAVQRFEAELTVRFYRKEHRIDVNGTVSADVTQTSVISLEPFIKPYHSEFSVFYDTELTRAQLQELDFEFDDEVPDLVENGQIDLGAIAMEQLALVLDDFPRREGEVFEFKSEFDEETTAAAHPFAALAKLKK